MSQMIQAYFKTENDAEKVRIKLEKLNVDHLEIGELDTPLRSSNLFVPLAILPTAGTSGTAGGGITNDNAGIGGGGYGPYLGFAEINRSLEHNNDPGEAPEHLDECNMVLSVRVADSDFSEAIEIIADNEGLVEDDRES